MVHVELHFFNEFQFYPKIKKMIKSKTAANMKRKGQHIGGVEGVVILGSIHGRN